MSREDISYMQEEELAVLKAQGTVTAFFCTDQQRKRVRGPKNPQNSLKRIHRSQRRLHDFSEDLPLCYYRIDRRTQLQALTTRSLQKNYSTAFHWSSKL